MALFSVKHPAHFTRNAGITNRCFPSTSTQRRPKTRSLAPLEAKIGRRKNDASSRLRTQLFTVLFFRGAIIFARKSNPPPKAPTKGQFLADEIKPPRIRISGEREIRGPPRLRSEWPGNHIFSKMRDWKSFAPIRRFAKTTFGLD